MSYGFEVGGIQVGIKGALVRKAARKSVDRTYRDRVATKGDQSPVASRLKIPAVAYHKGFAGRNLSALERLFDCLNPFSRRGYGRLHASGV